MSDTAFNRIMSGLDEALRHASGEEVPGMAQSGGILGPGGEVTHYHCEWRQGGDAVVTIAGGKPMMVSDLLRHLNQPYHVPKPDEGWRREFSDAEKAALRPVAETLAMLDGNAFLGCDLGDGREWYEQYLPEAHALWASNGSPALGSAATQSSPP